MTLGRNMKRRYGSIWTQPLENIILRLPFGPFLLCIIYVATLFGLNLLVIYSAITGNMIGKYSFAPVEGRESAPILYWIYLAGISFGALFFDIYILSEVLKSRRNKK